MPPPLPFCESLFVTALSVSVSVALNATCKAPPFGLLPPTPLPLVSVTPETLALTGTAAGVPTGGATRITRLPRLALTVVWRAPAPTMLMFASTSSSPPNWFEST